MLPGFEKQESAASEGMREEPRTLTLPVTVKGGKKMTWETRGGEKPRLTGIEEGPGGSRFKRVRPLR